MPAINADRPAELATLGLERVTVPVVLFGVATPDELDGLPIRAWVLLDCSDEERRLRLHADGRDHDSDAAVRDARHYRSLGLPVIDTTARTPALVAADLADFVMQNERS